MLVVLRQSRDTSCGLVFVGSSMSIFVKVRLKKRRAYLVIRSPRFCGSSWPSPQKGRLASRTHNVDFVRILPIDRG